jgi:nucleotide-binding universal stress UspA family protein
MKIIAALDFSETSGRVLSAVKTYAARLNDAEVFLIHVEPPEPAFIGYDPGPQSVRDQVAEDFRNEHIRLRKSAEKLKKDGVNATPLLLQGPISQTILDEAGRLGADLIITGSHGHSLLHNVLVGSTSEGILKKSKIPVLVVPS